MKQVISIALWLFCLIILGTAATSWFMSKHVYKCKPTVFDTGIYDSLIDANRKLLDSATMVNIRLSEKNNEYMNEITRLKQSRDFISKKYINLYYEINNTTDSGQLAITKELLSRLGYYHAKGY